MALLEADDTFGIWFHRFLYATIIIGSIGIVGILFSMKMGWYPEEWQKALIQE